jgi:hypothetical protein
MKVLILGEGPTDLGRAEIDGTLQLEGALPILVRKLISDPSSETPIEIRGIEYKKLRLFGGVSGKRRSSKGYVNKLRALIGLREGREADAIVAVVDRDGERFNDRIDDLNDGREELSRAGKACAVGMTIEELEAWLLADEKALRIALEDESIQRQPDPEKLSARDEKNDRNPKGRLERLMVAALEGEIPQSDFPEHYAAIAREIDLAVLDQRCPEGFGPFAQQVRELVPRGS